MNPEERKLRVLAFIVESYAKTGEPVSSKSICDNIGFSISSATIRNDMAELTEFGLLKQPHTSSGRVPSDLGYRLYINKLMDKETVSKKEKDEIFELLFASSDAPEHLLEEASSLLASFTGFAVVSTTPAGSLSKIKNIQLVRVGSRSAMLVLITSAGMIKNKLFRCDFNLNSEVLSLFYNVLNEKFCNIPLCHITLPFLQRVAAEMGEIGLLMTNVFLALLSAVDDAQKSHVTTDGETNLLLIPEFEMQDAKKIMELFGKNGDIIEFILGNQTDSVNILIGKETQKPELRDFSVVVSKYNVSGEASGAIAVIGPTRMDYPKVIAGLECITDTVEKLLAEILES